MMTPEQLRKLSDEIVDESEDLKEIASSKEQWEAVQQLDQAARLLFSAAGALDIHTEKYELSSDT